MAKISFYIPGRVQIEVKDVNDKEQVFKAIENRSKNFPRQRHFRARLETQYLKKRHIVDEE